MKRKNLMLAVAAAAALGAFNPALAGEDNAGIGSTDINAGASISPGVNVGSSGDQSVSSGLSESQSQSSTDSNRPSNAELSAAATASTTEGPDSGDKQRLN